MKRFVTLLIAFALGVFATTQLQHLLVHPKPPGHEEEPEKEAHADKPHPPSVQVERLDDGGSVVIIPTNLLENLHLKTATVRSEEAPAETRAFGRVLDPAPFVATVVEIESAVAAARASRLELARSRTLFAQDQNASARNVEAAEAAAARDELQLQGARLKLGATWGTTLANRTNLANLAQRLARLEIALVRLDVPLTEIGVGRPVEARMAVTGLDERFVTSELLGPAPSADPSIPGHGILGLVQAAGLPHGATLSGWLRTDAQPHPLPVIPAGALLRHEGGVFVQLAAAPGKFERRRVTLDRPRNDGWFVRDGLKGGESVVIEGAQQILSAELKAGGGGDE